MTAELADERLATLIAFAEQCSKPWIAVDVPAALRELQAYRAKRETHVWVPKEPTQKMLQAGIDAAYEPASGTADVYRAMLAASDGNTP